MIVFEALFLKRLFDAFIAVQHSEPSNLLTSVLKQAKMLSSPLIPFIPTQIITKQTQMRRRQQAPTPSFLPSLSLCSDHRTSWLGLLAAFVDMLAVAF